MEMLDFTKNDLRYLLAATAILPVICFVAGIYVANDIRIENAALPAEQAPALEASSAIMSQIDLLPGSSLQAEEIPLKTTDKTPPETNDKPASPKHRFIVQAGLFSSRDNAEHLIDALTRQQIDAQRIDRKEAGLMVYRVILGTFDSRDAAIQLSKRLEAEHHLSLYVAELSDNPKPGFVASL